MSETPNNNSNRGEILSALVILILFISMVSGREIGRLYSTYDEMKGLKVFFKVTEEEMSNYLTDVLEGKDPNLNFGISIVHPEIQNEAGLVTSTPDYAKRWFISLTLSPIVVNQPAVSDIEVLLSVEGEVMTRGLYNFTKQNVSLFGFVDREVILTIDDVPRLRKAVEEAANQYGGEVEVTLQGQSRAHLLFLETWLPFTVTRYPLVRLPDLIIEDSEWRSLDGRPIQEAESGQRIQVSVRYSNPTRFHSIQENVTCILYKQGVPEPVVEIIKKIGVASGLEASYSFFITFEEPGEYTYLLNWRDLQYGSLDDPDIITITGPQ
jgi:hypothetical protein